jgi:hypothetical protein
MAPRVDPDPFLSRPRRHRGRRAARGVGRTTLDRPLPPLNRLSSERFLREARQKVWHNTVELQQARMAGEQVYAARLAELEVLSAARIADLLAPGQVLLRLAVAGFGVTLPPPGVQWTLSLAEPRGGLPLWTVLSQFDGAE